jgi:hypothetical protein
MKLVFRLVIFFLVIGFLVHYAGLNRSQPPKPVIKQKPPI